MTCEKETLKALLMLHDGVSFWIRKSWLNANGLTPAGWKAFHIAKRKRNKNIFFDATKEFEVVHRTEKAVLLRCDVELPEGKKTKAEFWLPYSLVCNFGYVEEKIMEVEKGFPFVGTHVIWSGWKDENKIKEGEK